MSQDDKEKIQRGSDVHKEALARLELTANNAGNRGDEFLEAIEALKSLQKELDWQLPEGVVDSDGVGRELAVELLDNRFCRVKRGDGFGVDWPEFKKRWMSQPLANKEDARYFLLSRFRSDGFEKLSFKENPIGKSSYGISRCKENVEWIDGLTLDFDSGLTPAEFSQRFSSYEYLLYSSYNHDPGAGKNKFRVLMPLKDRVGLVELQKRRNALKALFKEADPASFSVSQGFYMPSHPPGKTPVRVENTGDWFDLMELDVGPERQVLFNSSFKVSGDGDAAEVIAAIMNCMPPDTEYFRDMPGTGEHTYGPVIVPFLSSLGYWGKENGLDSEGFCQLVDQRWGQSTYSESFYRVIDRASYGGLEACQRFIGRVENAIGQGVKLGFEEGEFERARTKFDRLVLE